MGQAEADQRRKENQARRQMLPLAWELKHQWTQARPKMVEEMRAGGVLFQLLEQAGNRGAAMYDRLRDKQGLSHEQAMELVYDDLQKLPEENQKELGGPVLPYS